MGRKKKEKVDRFVGLLFRGVEDDGEEGRAACVRVVEEGQVVKD